MRSKNSNELNETLKLLEKLESGILDSITCPRCHNDSVTVRFSNPEPNEYRTWLVCLKCSFVLRLQNTERPQFYSTSRIDEQLEAYDYEVIGKMIFKRRAKH